MYTRELKRKGKLFSHASHENFKRLKTLTLWPWPLDKGPMYVPTLLVAEALPKLKTFNAFLSFEQ